MMALHNYFGISSNKIALFKEKWSVNSVDDLLCTYVPLFFAFRTVGLDRLALLGNVPSRIVYYLMNINAAKRTIYLVRVGVRLFLTNCLS